MQKRKNVLILIFVLLLSFVMTGCGGRENTSDTSQAAGGNRNDAELSQEQESSSSESMESLDEAGTAEMGTAEMGTAETGTQAEKMEAGDMSEEGGKVLIAYFSHTGNTAEAAQGIEEYTGGDLAEIKRAEEYGDLQEEAEVEIKNGIHQEITVSISNAEDYDTVFVGYPIWLAYHNLIQCTQA